MTLRLRPRRRLFLFPTSPDERNTRLRYGIENYF